MPHRQWKTEEEIDQIIDTRFEAFEKRIGPTLEALRDGAQSALMTNTLLVGDDRFQVKGFISETRERFKQIETRQEQMHQENRAIIGRAFSWLMSKNENGEQRWHRIALAAGAAGSAIVYIAAHMALWVQQLAMAMHGMKG